MNHDIIICKILTRKFLPTITHLTSSYTQILGKITSEGVFLEQLEQNPGQYLPEVEDKDLGGEVIKVCDCAGH